MLIINNIDFDWKKKIYIYIYIYCLNPINKLQKINKIKNIIYKKINKNLSQSQTQSLREGDFFSVF